MTWAGLSMTILATFKEYVENMQIEMGGALVGLNLLRKMRKGCTDGTCKGNSKEI
jgi:hypothetical protein